MNKKWLFLLMVLIIPVIVYATSYSFDVAESMANDYHKNYYDSKKYILQIPGGLLSNEEYHITMPTNQNFRTGSAYSYLYDGQPFWLKNGYVNLKGDVANKEAAEGRTPKGFKATLYVDPTTNSAGSGTYSNPWIFLQKYKVSLMLDSRHGVICEDELCTNVMENSTKMVLDGKNVEFYIDADDGFAYLNNTCNGVYTSQGGNKGIGKITIYNVNRNIINCKLTFGTGLYELTVRNQNPDTGIVGSQVLFTIYEEYSKGWFTTNDKAQQLDNGMDIINYYNHRYDEENPWLINVFEPDKPNYLAPESNGYVYNGIKIYIEKLDGTTEERSLTSSKDNKIIDNNTQIKSEQSAQIDWAPKVFTVFIKDCHNGETSCTDLNFSDMDKATFNAPLTLKSSHIKQYNGLELDGYYSAPTGGDLIFDTSGHYMVDSETYGKKYRVVGDTTVYARYKRCPAGQYSNNDTGYKCTNCPRGYANPNEASGSCEKCKKGKFSEEGAISCSSCPAGTESQWWWCRDCDAGKYSPAGEECLTCPTGYISGSKASACTICPAGKETDDEHKECHDCAFGYYKEENQTQCSQCQTGKITGEHHEKCETCDPGKSASQDRKTCEDCRAGYYSDSNHITCTKCPAGTYNDSPGQSECTPCSSAGDKAYSADPGATQCSFCNNFQNVNADRTGCDGIEYTVTLHNNVLPEGYTRISYIENEEDDEAYIKLGVQPDNGDGIFGFYMKYRPEDELYSPIDDDSVLATFLGNKDTSSNEQLIVSNTQVQACEDCGSVSGGLSVNVDARRWDCYYGGYYCLSSVSDGDVVTFNTNYNEGQVNVLTYINGNINGVNNDFTTRGNDNELYLFANNIDGSADEHAHGRLYRLILYHGKTPFADYLPCRENSSSKIGLCNFKGTGNIFKASSNSDSFKAGSTINDTNRTFTIKYNEKYKKINSLPSQVDKLTFEGYYTEPTGGVQIYKANGDPVNNNITYNEDGYMVLDLYAHWKVNEYQ